MKITKNENALDRFLRLLVAELLFLGGFFWLGGWSAIAVYILSAIALFTATTGFCSLYPLFKINTAAHPFKVTKTKTILAIIILFAVGIPGIYYGNFFTKKIFLEDYNQINDSYKQTLFYTGQNKRDEAVENYNKLLAEYPIFLNKYTKYHPPAIKADKQFNPDISDVYTLIISLNDQILNGDLADAHIKLEEVRPVFQDILKRNGFSMLAVTLVDFHDAMEKIITAADAKDTESLIDVYPEVDEKLKAVEEIANDEEIQTIRQKLDETYALAKDGKADELSAKAAELKSSFVKVYLKRG